MSFFSSYENNVSLNQSILNNIVQGSKSECIYSCTQVSDLNLEFVDTNVETLNASQQCNIVGDSCILKVAMDNTTQNKLNSLIKQTQTLESDLLSFDFGSNSDNTVTLEQGIRNLISQATNLNCKQPSNQTSHANIVFIDSSIQNINLSQTSSVTAGTCSINTVVTNVANNSETSTVDQSIKKLGPLALIAIAVIIVVVGIIVIVVVHGGSKAYSNYSEAKKDENEEKYQQKINNDNLLFQEEEMMLKQPAPQPALQPASQPTWQALPQPSWQQWTLPNIQPNYKIKQIKDTTRDMRSLLGGQYPNQVRETSF